MEWDDGSLVIRVLHIRDFVSAECGDANQVKTVFEGLVDEYLEDCRRLGKAPDKPFKGTFNVRVDPALHRRAVVGASSTGCSLNELVGNAIREYVEKLEIEATWGRSRALANVELGKVVERLMTQTVAVDRAWGRVSPATTHQYKAGRKRGISEQRERAMDALSDTTETKLQRGQWRQVN